VRADGQKVLLAIKTARHFGTRIDAKGYVTRFARFF
jgi:hypothetical protein